MAIGQGKDSAETSPMTAGPADQDRRPRTEIDLRFLCLSCVEIINQFGLAPSYPVPLMTLRPLRIDCSRSRNSSVTAPASTLFRMSFVLMKMMISDRVLVLDVFPSRSPMNLISRIPGIPACDLLVALADKTGKQHGLTADDGNCGVDAALRDRRRQRLLDPR